jgi:aspartate/methionine/tyrosine aminotransferase
LDALAPLETTIGGSGAMYVMGKLPAGMEDDMFIGELLVEKYGIAIIPGSFCGYPGWIRVCYSNLNPEDCLIAADRLEKGIAFICK